MNPYQHFQSLTKRADDDNQSFVAAHPVASGLGAAAITGVGAMGLARAMGHGTPVPAAVAPHVAAGVGKGRAMAALGVAGLAGAAAVARRAIINDVQRNAHHMSFDGATGAPQWGEYIKSRFGFGTPTPGKHVHSSMVRANAPSRPAPAPERIFHAGPPSTDAEAAKQVISNHADAAIYRHPWSHVDVNAEVQKTIANATPEQVADAITRRGIAGRTANRASIHTPLYTGPLYEGGATVTPDSLMARDAKQRANIQAVKNASEDLILETIIKIAAFLEDTYGQPVSLYRATQDPEVIKIAYTMLENSNEKRASNMPVFEVAQVILGQMYKSAAEEQSQPEMPFAVDHPYLTSTGLGILGAGAGAAVGHGQGLAAAAALDAANLGEHADVAKLMTHLDHIRRGAVIGTGLAALGATAAHYMGRSKYEQQLHAAGHNQEMPFALKHPYITNLPLGTGGNLVGGSLGGALGTGATAFYHNEKKKEFLNSLNQ